VDVDPAEAWYRERVGGDPPGEPVTEQQVGLERVEQRRDLLRAAGRTTGRPAGIVWINSERTALNGSRGCNPLPRAAKYRDRRVPGVADGGVERKHALGELGDEYDAAIG